MIADLQIGSMGGVAVTMALRLDASSAALPAVPVLLLLDRVADVHLAKRCGADGWLVKPLDPCACAAPPAPSPRRRSPRALGDVRRGRMPGGRGRCTIDPTSGRGRSEAADCRPGSSGIWAVPR